MASTQREMEESGWFAKVLFVDSLGVWYSTGSQMKGPEATFIVVEDRREYRHLVIIDPEFDANGRVPHDVVLRKFRALGYNDIRVLGGGVVKRNLMKMVDIKHYCSDTIGRVPDCYKADVMNCLGACAAGY